MFWARSAVNGVTAYAQHPPTGLWLSTVSFGPGGGGQRRAGRPFGGGDFPHRLRQVPVLSTVRRAVAASDAGSVAVAGVDAGPVGFLAAPRHFRGQHRLGPKSR